MAGPLTLRDLWRSRRASVTAHAALHPFLPALGITDLARPVRAATDDWSDAYLIGFLTASISLIARNTAPRLSSDGLGHVQCKVYSALTGVPGDLVAERIIRFSLGRDLVFMTGCADALTFTSALAAEAAQADIADAGLRSESISLWQLYVGGRLADLQPGS
ncbi:hypothetical protein G3T14_15220 [Methylobacterium sp. BTF04]|uniref:hypothetical protein n=1 Tax=Methylobacterium sp. BTF04 TaxID=2708300 RepID=UPI0013D2E615|nr:hypothetical protein [Methylobacterium sp. BTF04]NEU13472.1 hypothetical protein [Methylobacterium sp. BTF04]